MTEVFWQRSAWNRRQERKSPKCLKTPTPLHQTSSTSFMNTWVYPMHKAVNYYTQTLTAGLRSAQSSIYILLPGNLSSLQIYPTHTSRLCLGFCSPWAFTPDYFKIQEQEVSGRLFMRAALMSIKEQPVWFVLSGVRTQEERPVRKREDG